MDRSVKFWDRIAQRYSRSPISDEASYQKKLEVTREYLRPDVEVMEFGCGTGSTALAHAPHVKHILAVDVSLNMIDIARAKAVADGVDNVTFTQSSIDELEVADQSFDAVLGMSILHLLRNKEAVIDKVYNVLKPGGVFVTSTICMGESMLRLLRPVLAVGRFFGLLPLVRFFSVEGLMRSMTTVGFDIEHKWQPGKGKAVFIVARRARQSPSDCCDAGENRG